METHNPFKAYENKHKSRSAILFGSGPSILNFDPSIVPDNVLRFGVNDQIFLNLSLDYWFMGDAMPQIPDKFYDRFEEFDEYTPKEQKFIRLCNWKDEREISVPRWGKVPRNGQLPNLKNSKYYIADSGGNPEKCLFKKDISGGNLFAVASITFEVLQFMLYCGVKKIYLVGQDSDYTNGTFRGYKIGLAQGAGPCILNYWKLVDDWIKENYPDVEIFSINPVGLKLFPEVLATNII
jgi:hypothetical protein